MRAVCPACEYPMQNGRGCTIATVQIAGQVYQRIPYGDARDLLGLPNCSCEDCRHRVTPCHDCAVSPGQFHHDGCDAERCPRCSGQAITCTCEAGP